MNPSKRLRRLGRRFFTLMWLPFAGIFIGMIGMPDGSYGWSELPILTRFSLLAVGVCGAAAMGLLMSSMIVASSQNRKILSTGLPAQAIILKLTDTGTTVNRNPLVRLTLEVRPEDEEVFEAQLEKVVSRLEIPQVQPGGIVQVKYDPESKAVALVSADSIVAAANEPPMPTPPSSPAT